MNQRQLEYFISLAETNNMTTTADRLFVSQAAISKSLSELEDELGCRLFTRTGKRLAINEQGLLFLPMAKDLYDHMKRVPKEFREKAGVLERRIVIDTCRADYLSIPIKDIRINTVIPDRTSNELPLYAFYPELFKQNPPEILQSLRSVPEVIDDIDSERTDIAVIECEPGWKLQMGKEINDKGLVFSLLAEDQLIFICDKDYPVGNEDAVDYRSIKHSDIFFHSDRLNDTVWLEALNKECGLSWDDYGPMVPSALGYKSLLTSRKPSVTSRFDMEKQFTHPILTAEGWRFIPIINKSAFRNIYLVYKKQNKVMLRKYIHTLTMVYSL